MLGLTSHSPLAERDIHPFARLAYCSHPINKESIKKIKIKCKHNTKAEGFISRKR